MSGISIELENTIYERAGEDGRVRQTISRPGQVLTRLGLETMDHLGPNHGFEPTEDFQDVTPHFDEQGNLL